MSDEQNTRINKVFRIKGHGREILTDHDIDWFVFELEKCRVEVKRLRKMQPIANVTLIGDAEYFKTQAEKAEAEVKRLKAILANKGTEF